MNPVCVPCKREMVCSKTGGVIHFGGGHCYAGDVFACRTCINRVVVGLKNSMHLTDKELKTTPIYIEMEQ